MEYQQRLHEFQELIKEIEFLKYTLNTVLYWDKLQSLPKGATDYHNGAMGLIADQMQGKLSDMRFSSFVKYFDHNPNNDWVTNHMIVRILRNQYFVNQVSPKVSREYTALIALSEDIWHQARAQNDYTIFAPYLEQIIEKFKYFSNAWGYQDHPYDALLDYHLEGLTTKRLDGLMAKMKPFLLDALSRIVELGEGESFAIPAPPEQQHQLWQEVLEDLGFDFSRGRIDPGQYTTILNYSVDDVRILIDLEEDSLFVGLFDCLHSGGKGIYHQNISRNLMGTFLCETPSFSCEEAIGRFYENLARHRGFWVYMKGKYPDIFADYTVEQLYRQANHVAPNCIRIQRDEITDLLHIFIRYEIEKDLLLGNLKPCDLKDAWNKAYEDYLGVTPKDDKEGVLQDIHWSMGYFGYFPTYIMSNIICAQLYHQLEEDMGEIDGLLARGEFQPINLWLKEKVFQYGAILSTDALIEQATHKPLSSQDYLAYLKEKYSFIYQINL